jgi:hypothetical protein
MLAFARPSNPNTATHPTMTRADLPMIPPDEEKTFRWMPGNASIVPSDRVFEAKDLGSVSSNCPWPDVKNVDSRM